MGITRVGASLLHDVVKDKSLRKDNICQLGKQWLYFDEEYFEEFLTKRNIQYISNNKFKFKNSVPNEVFFEHLGFKEVYSLDVSNYENPSFVADLNLDVDEKLHNKFDCIYDGGTIEHVFNIPKFFENIFKMLKVGGYIMHMTPSNNFLDHGFYSISPTLYYDYYSKNKFKILKSSVYINTGKGSVTNNQQQNKNFLLDYSPGCIHHKSMGGWSSENIMSWFCVQKTEESTYNFSPTQSQIQNAWVNKGSETIKKPKNKILAKIYDKLKNIRLVYKIYLKFLDFRKKLQSNKVKLKLKKIKL